MSRPGAPDDRPASSGGIGRRCGTALAALFALGVVMLLTRDDLRPLGLLLMVASAVVFLTASIVARSRRGARR